MNFNHLELRPDNAGDISSNRNLTKVRFFSVRHQLISKRTEKRGLALEFQRKRSRVSQSAAQRAAKQKKLATIRKSNRLIVVQMKRCTHQLQRAVRQREKYEDSLYPQVRRK